MHNARNYEIKIRIENFTRLQKLSEKFQSQCISTERFTEIQHDIYYKVRNGRLKLRVINNKSGNLISYNRNETTGKRISNYTISRTEDFIQLNEILKTEFEVLIEVKKSREIFICDEVRIHLDKVKGLGKFLEFEVVYSNLSSAKRRMSQLIRDFDLNENEFIRHSYSDMKLNNL